MTAKKPTLAPQAQYRTVKVATLGGEARTIAVNPDWSLDELFSHTGIALGAKAYGLKKGSHKQIALESNSKVNGYDEIVVVAEKVAGGC